MYVTRGFFHEGRFFNSQAKDWSYPTVSNCQHAGILQCSYWSHALLRLPLSIAWARQLSWSPSLPYPSTASTDGSSNRLQRGSPFCMHALSLRGGWFFVFPCIVAHQAPLSMEFSQQGYWSELPFPTPGDLPDPGNETIFPAGVKWILYHCSTKIHYKLRCNRRLLLLSSPSLHLSFHWNQACMIVWLVFLSTHSFPSPWSFIGNFLIKPLTF